MRYGYFDNENREYVIDRVDVRWLRRHQVLLPAQAAGSQNEVLVTMG